MVIECSSCHARFKLADDKIKGSGTKVRCTKCREVFTVFPPPPIAPPAAPIDPVVPVTAPEKKVVEDALFAGTDTSSLSAEPPPPAGGVPANEEDDWNQDAVPNLFSDRVPDDAGASDLDAISFDNIEAPVFSVSSEKNSKFEFSDDTAFSFSELSLESTTQQPHKIAEAIEEQPWPEESDSDFEADASSPAHPPSPENLNQSTPVAIDGDFTLSGTDDFADFSWDEPDAKPIATTSPEQIRDTGSTPQDTSFDFSSFSFDDVDSSAGSDENKSDETVTQSKEPAVQDETATAPVENRPSLIEIEALPSPLVGGRQESTPRQTRPMRPRARQKKKGSSRLAVKIIIIILLALAAISAVMNRDQIQKSYKNIVSGFIENQTRIETSGQIDLVKLSGNYVSNRQEGDFFVIRGQAVNKFKGLRSSVLVRGTIYGDNGAVLQSQSAYCGNPLMDSSLKNLRFKEIRDVMSNELGENLVNLNIATGKEIPFTIVFNKAPKNIKEFTVEVLESKPGSK